ncbi:hypothetical protein AGRO_3118 [Agrobacterium sp. ATCC 31749]|nr:hypothetical protein AGRO_3118 [Agrobacterium sp. ATCC 31749]
MVMKLLHHLLVMRSVCADVRIEYGKKLGERQMYSKIEDYFRVIKLYGV